MNASIPQPGAGAVHLNALPDLSGLDFMRAIVAGRLPNPPIADLMHFRATEVTRGTIVFAGAPQPDVYNLIQTVHGGYAATLLDSAMACAVLTMLEAGSSFTTLEIKINYVRAMTAATGIVSARGEVIQQGRRIATAEGRLTDAEGRLYAFGTTTCLIVPRE